MMKHKAAFITMTVYGLIVFALLARNGDLFLMILPLIIYLGAGLYFAPNEINLGAVRQVVQNGEASGTCVVVDITLTNQGETLKNVFLCEQQDAELPGEKYEQRLAIAEMGAARLHYTFQAHRGQFSWQTVRVFARDPFGLVGIQKDIPARGEILVPPEFEKLSHIHLNPKSTLHSAGLVPARRGGSGLNFWAIREYQVGDSLRWLNWKTIARHPRQLYTTEFEHEEIMEIGIILDARYQAGSLFDGKMLFEHSVRASMSFAELFLREGNRVGLLVFGQEMTPLQPGYGKRQLHRISTALARATIRSNFSLTYLEYVQKRLFSSRALIVVISPLDLNDLPTYKQLRAAGNQILLVSPDPVSFVTQAGPSGGVLDLALRTTRIERYALLKQLLQIGVTVVDWNVQRSLNETLHTIFLKRTNGDLYV